jgi:hypothetical protein
MTQIQHTLKNNRMLKVAVIPKARLKNRPGFEGSANE